MAAKQNVLSEDWAAVPKKVRDTCDEFVVAHLKHLAALDKAKSLGANEDEAEDAAFDAMEKANIDRVKVDYKGGSKMLERTLKKKLNIKKLPKSAEPTDGETEAAE